MTEPLFRLCDGEMIELTPDDIAQVQADFTAEFQRLKSVKIADLQAEANKRVMAALPDMEKAGAVRSHQSALASTISTKMKPHTLAAIDITAGWPD